MAPFWCHGWTRPPSIAPSRSCDFDSAWDPLAPDVRDMGRPKLDSDRGAGAPRAPSPAAPRVPPGRLGNNWRMDQPG